MELVSNLALFRTFPRKKTRLWAGKIGFASAPNVLSLGQESLLPMVGGLDNVNYLVWRKTTSKTTF